MGTVKNFGLLLDQIVFGPFVKIQDTNGGKKMDPVRCDESFGWFLQVNLFPFVVFVCGSPLRSTHDFMRALAFVFVCLPLVCLLNQSRQLSQTRQFNGVVAAVGIGMGVSMCGVVVVVGIRRGR